MQPDPSGYAAVNSYDAYGLPASGNIGWFQYTGQIWLEEAGLYHYKARAYHPALGRFMQPDPIGYAAGMNMYAYVGGDPINATDPSGLCSEEDNAGTPCKIVVIGHKGGGGGGGFSAWWANGSDPFGNSIFDIFNDDGAAGFADDVRKQATQDVAIDVACSIAVPIAPPGVNILENIATSQERADDSLTNITGGVNLNPGDYVWFYETVRNGGVWDYKQQNAVYPDWLFGSFEDFGNFNFGATGRALGIPRSVLLRGAGIAQSRAGASDSDWGAPPSFPNLLGDAPYGDDPADQAQINRGADFYEQCVRR